MGTQTKYQYHFNLKEVKSKPKSIKQEQREHDLTFSNLHIYDRYSVN